MEYLFHFIQELLETVADPVFVLGLIMISSHYIIFLTCSTWRQTPKHTIHKAMPPSLWPPASIVIIIII